MCFSILFMLSVKHRLLDYLYLKEVYFSSLSETFIYYVIKQVVSLYMYNVDVLH